MEHWWQLHCEVAWCRCQRALPWLCKCEKTANRCEKNKGNGRERENVRERRSIGVEKEEKRKRKEKRNREKGRMEKGY